MRVGGGLLQEKWSEEERGKPGWKLAGGLFERKWLGGNRLKRAVVEIGRGVRARGNVVGGDEGKQGSRLGGAVGGGSCDVRKRSGGGEGEAGQSAGG